MIYFLSTRAHEYTWRRSLEFAYRLDDQSIRHELLERITLLSYEALFELTELAAGTYMFSDLERLSAQQTERAALYWRALANAGEGFRVVNHPIRSMRRFELQRHLYAAGINAYDVQRLTEPLRLTRFPMFIRSESGHFIEDMSDLLDSAEAIDQVAQEWIQVGKNREDKIIVEYLDTRDAQGHCHKYNAILVGNQPIALGRVTDKDWIIKGMRQVPPDHDEVAQHWADYGEQLAAIMNLAHLDYGRIDYAVVDGRVQVFEVNTNPTVGAAEFLLEIARVLDSAPSDRRISIELPPAGKRGEKPKKGHSYRISRQLYLTLKRWNLVHWETRLLALASTLKRWLPRQKWKKSHSAT